MDPLTSPGPEYLPAPTEPTDVVPVPVPSLPFGPLCAACQEPAVVHWQRRPTDDEMEALLLAEHERREEVRKHADRQLPPPVFPPLPTAAETTLVVHACGRHAITIEAAALIHASACTAPNEADLPGCDCTPEPWPADPPAEEEQSWELPGHWVSGGQ